MWNGSSWRESSSSSPTFLAVLRGPDHVIELTDPAFQQLIGDRKIVGKPVRDAMPEVEGQGFFELLDGVYATGVPFVGNELPLQMRRNPDTALETRYVSFVYQPMRGADGAPNGVLVSGTTSRRWSGHARPPSAWPSSATPSGASS